MYSLRSLLLIVGVAALGSAALIYRTSFWACLIVSLTLGIFLFGSLRIYSDPPKRPFWIPCLLVGLPYLAIALVGVLEIDKHLITSRFIFQIWYAGADPELAAKWGAAYLQGPSDFEETFYYFVLPSGAMTWDIGLVEQSVVHEFRRVYAVAQSLIALGLGALVGAVFLRRSTEGKTA
jgi:hypothetical protein